MTRPPSPAEPVTELRKVKIVECGEPLVDFLARCPELIPVQPVFAYTRASLVRESVAKKLERAVSLLRNGYRLGVLEGWRPKYIQRRMWLTSWLRFKKLHPEWSDHTLKRVVNRYVAPPDSVVPPPHSTGGAVDVFLVDAQGRRLDHSSPYEPFDPKAYALENPNLTPEARRNRSMLRDVLLEAGLTNYPSEWWHWSYGDQGWAYRANDGRSAIYARIDEAPGWKPVREDDTDEPLKRVDLAGAESEFPKVSA